MGRDGSFRIARRGGFLAFKSPRAEALSHRLRHDGVATDSRGEMLRLGPAPYLSDEQLRAAVRLLGQGPPHPRGGRFFSASPARPPSGTVAPPRAQPRTAAPPPHPH